MTVPAVGGVRHLHAAPRCGRLTDQRHVHRREHRAARTVFRTPPAPTGRVGVPVRGRLTRMAGDDRRDADRDAADAVLAALDPEQREVATTLTGPVCVLAGAGTGKTRAITHRIAYGVHTGGLRAAARARRHLHRPGRRRDAHPAARPRRRRGAGPHLPRRGAAPAALLLAPGASAARPPEVLEHKAGLVAEAAARLRLPRRPRRGARPRAPRSSGPRSACSTPETYAAAAPHAAGRDPAGLDPPTVARLLEALRAGQARARRHRLRGRPAACTVGVLAGPPAGRRRRSAAQYRHFVVDEYQDVSPLQQRLLDLWLGEPRRPLRRRRRQPDHLLLHRRHARVPARTSPRRVSRPARVVRLVRDYRSTPQVVHAGQPASLARGRRPARAARLELVAQRPPGPEPELHGVRRRAGRGRRASPPGCGRADRAAARRPARSPCCSAPTRSPRRYEQALAEAGRRPTCCAAASGSSTGPRSARPVVLLRGAARSADAERAAAARPSRDGARRRRLDAPSPRPAGGAVRERWESLPRWPRSPTSSPRPGRARRCADLVDRAGRAGRRPARADRRGRHPRLAARRQGPGVGRGLPRRADRGPAADHATPRAASGRGGAPAALRRRHPGPRAPVRCPGRAARTPGGRATPQAVAVPRRAARPADPSAAAGRRRSGVRARTRAGAGRWPRTCRVCGRPADDRRPSASSAAAPTARRPTTRSCSSGCAPGGCADRGAAKVPAYVVFTDATLTALAETRPGDLAELAGIAGRRADQAGAVRRRRCWPCWRVGGRDGGPRAGPLSRRESRSATDRQFGEKMRCALSRGPAPPTLSRAVPPEGRPRRTRDREEVGTWRTIIAAGGGRTCLELAARPSLRAFSRVRAQ